jgi:hypothetical protein
MPRAETHAFFPFDAADPVRALDQPLSPEDRQVSSKRFSSRRGVLFDRRVARLPPPRPVLISQGCGSAPPDSLSCRHDEWGNAHLPGETNDVSRA